MPNTPTIRHADGLTIGQLARHWQRSHDFVRRLISEGKLAVDERGVITHETLHGFYRTHATELD